MNKSTERQLTGVEFRPGSIVDVVGLADAAGLVDAVGVTSPRMVNSKVDPSAIAPPAANYAHAMLSVGPARILHTSGVVPVPPAGDVPGDIGAQARTVWDNIKAMLAEAEMVPADIVSVITYVIPGQDLAAVMAERDRALDGHLAASTLVIVPELAQAAWKMEIAVVAAR